MDSTASNECDNFVLNHALLSLLKTMINIVRTITCNGLLLCAFIFAGKLND